MYYFHKKHRGVGELPPHVNVANRKHGLCLSLRLVCRCLPARTRRDRHLPLWYAYSTQLISPRIRSYGPFGPYLLILHEVLRSVGAASPHCACAANRLRGWIWKTRCTYPYHGFRSDAMFHSCYGLTPLDRLPGRVFEDTLDRLSYWGLKAFPP